MCEAAMPGDHQKLVFRKDVAQHVTVWKYCAKHQRPSSDSRAAHRAHGKHVVAGAECFANQCAGDAVCDGVHTLKGSVRDSHFTNSSGERLDNTVPTRRASMPRARKAWTAASQALGSIDTSRPPEVCGSKSKSRFACGTGTSNSAQSPMNSRLFRRPPGRKPSFAASTAPGNNENAA